jgi:hypothetical protein
VRLPRSVCGRAPPGSGGEGVTTREVLLLRAVAGFVVAARGAFGSPAGSFRTMHPRLKTACVTSKDIGTSTAARMAAATSALSGPRAAADAVRR